MQCSQAGNEKGKTDSKKRIKKYTVKNRNQKPQKARNKNGVYTKVSC